MGTPGVTRGTYLRVFIISPGAFVYVRVCIYLCSLKLRLNKYTDGTAIKITFPSWPHSSTRCVAFSSLSDYVKCVYTRSPISLSRRAVSLTKRKQALCRGKKLFSKNRYNVIKRAGASFHPEQLLLTTLCVDGDTGWDFSHTGMTNFVL
jgi:hypothetical protein